MDQDSGLAADSALADGAPMVCLGVDCGEHGQCAEEEEGARCLCQDPYVPDGLSCILDTEPPSDPSLLVAEYVSASQTDLIWNPSTDQGRVARYHVFRKLEEEESFSELDTSERAIYQDHSVVPGSKYVYVVSAEDGAQNLSGLSNEARVPEHGALSGTVRDSEGPISAMQMIIYAGPCYDRQLASTYTDADGHYSFAQVPASDIYVLAYAPSGIFNYFETWWTADGNGTRSCKEATPLAIEPGKTSEAVDFLLVPGAQLEGRVTFNGQPPSEPVHVQVRVAACDAGGAWDGSPSTVDAQGNYRVWRLPAGLAYVLAETGLDASLASQWYDEATGAGECDQAAPVQLVAGQTVSGIDFALQEKDLSGASVSGAVSVAGQPLPNIRLIAYSGQCGSGYLSRETYTDAAGSYSFAGLEVSQVYLRVLPKSYPESWWDGATGSTDCTDGTPIPLPANLAVTGIDFVLEEPGTISGRVILDGVGVSGVLVHAYQAPCDTRYLHGTISEANGLYTIANLPQGQAYVRTSAQNQLNFTFADRWYLSESESTLSCQAAAPLTITSGQTTAGVDLLVEQ